MHDRTLQVSPEPNLLRRLVTRNYREQIRGTCEQCCNEANPRADSPFHAVVARQFACYRVRVPRG